MSKGNLGKALIFTSKKKANQNGGSDKVFINIKRAVLLGGGGRGEGEGRGGGEGGGKRGEEGGEYLTSLYLPEWRRMMKEFC